MNSEKALKLFKKGIDLEWRKGRETTWKRVGSVIEFGHKNTQFRRRRRKMLEGEVYILNKLSNSAKVFFNDGMCILESELIGSEMTYIGRINEGRLMFRFDNLPVFIELKNSKYIELSVETI